MSCGCKGKPGKDPYADSLDAVWRDPMEYDVQKHGPPYMPVTASQRAEARQFAERQAAYYDTQQPQPLVDPHKALSQLLAFLRTLAMVHQTAHWQTRGGHYYSDHVLFQRLYDDSQEFIDGLAEKIVGLTNEPAYVSLMEQVGLIDQLARMAYQQTHSPGPGSEELVAISLSGEVSLLSAIDRVKAVMESAGALTEGLDDTLQGIASKHEEFVYLLQQRAAVAGYSYDRQG